MSDIFDYLIYTTSFILVLYVIKRLFGLSLKIETRSERRHRVMMERSYERMVHQAGQESIMKIIDDQAQKIRADFERTLKNMDTYTNERLHKTLSDQIKAHQQAAEAVKQRALKTIEASAGVFDKKNKQLDEMIDSKVEEIKNKLVENLEANLTDIVKVYVEAALKDTVNPDAQINSLIQQLERDKTKIIRDMKDELA